MKKQIIFIFTFLFIASVLDAQDRRPEIEFNIPGSFEIRNGGRFINIQNPPFNAKGDGVTDDTEAFVRAYNYLYDTLGSTQGYKDPFRSVIIYIPDGTYLISNTIIYDREIMYGYTRKSEGIHQVRIIGQSREGTTIRLKDHAEGFDGSEPKPVVSFGKMDFNNIPGSNTIRNLTINTGKGNPAAVGIKMAGANSASGSNVKIVSGDGKGMTGIDYSVGTVVGWYHDFVIDGFNYGIRLATENFVHPVLEHFTILNCNTSAFLLEGLASTTMRRVKVKDCKQAVISNGPGTFPTIIDCDFGGVDKSLAAIELDSGYLFARNVKVRRFRDLLDYDGKSPVSKNGNEIVVGGIVSPDNHSKTLNLEIKEVPLPWFSDPSEWANVNDYGANGKDKNDDSEAIQKAMNSGKKVVCFPDFLYNIDHTVTIPSHVELILGFYSSIEGSADTKFLVKDPGSKPLCIEDLDLIRNEQFRLETDRTLSFNNIGTKSNLFTKSEDVKGNEMFFSGTNGLRYSTPMTDARVWIRFINTESRNTQFLMNNTKAVVLGYKTEKNYASFEITNHSEVEILGGQSNQMAWNKDLDNPAMLIKDSKVALNFTVAQGWNKGFRVLVKLKEDGKEVDYERKDFPARSEKYEVIRAVPLFLSY